MTERPKVFVTRKLPEAALNLLRQTADVDVWDAQLPPDRETLAERLRFCNGLFSLLTDRIDAALLEQTPLLRVVSNMAVGYDNIDVPACTSRGIVVGNTPDVLTETTADLTFALLLAAARRIPEGVAYARSGAWKTWEPMLLLGGEVHGAMLGIIGLGRIGQAVARRARGFDMRVLYHSRSRHLDAEAETGAEWSPDLATLLHEADFVSIHVPLTPETRGLINAATLGQMKSTAYLINVARGPVVETNALVEALRSGSIMGAALDVTDPEPLPPEHPLYALPNALIVPHIASASTATRTRMATMATNNLLAGLRGELPPFCVNPEAHRVAPALRQAQGERVGS